MQEKNEIAIVKQQNQLAVLTSVNLPLNSNKSLELHFAYKKIRDYNEAGLKELYKLMLAICKLVGITEAPDEPITLLLIKHLQDHHKDFSKEEIQRAFSLATAGKLDFNFEHYNRITPQLISLTLNKYKDQRNKDLVLFNRESDKIKMIEDSEARKPSDEELHKRCIKSSIDFFELYKQSRINPKAHTLVPLQDYGNIVYKTLDKIGCINLAKDEKHKIYEDAIEIVIERAKMNRKNTVNNL